MSNEVDLRKQRKVEANVSVTGVSTEAKQDTQINLATLLNTYVDGIEALLISIDGKDFATQSTLLAIQGYVDGIEALLTISNVNTTGLNKEATQLLIKTAIEAINTKIDVSLSTRSSESTLLLIKAKTDNLDVELSTRLNTLGQNTSSLSAPVVLSTEQQAIITSLNKFGANTTNTVVNGSTVSVLLKAANVNRKEISIVNTNNKKMYVCRFTPATFLTSFILKKGDLLIDDTYTGAYYAIWEATADTDPSNISEVTT